MYCIVLSYYYGGILCIELIAFCLYPITNQVALIQKTFDCTRVVYNHYLEKQNHFLKKEKMLYLTLIW